MIQVDITESLWNRTEGLCGKLDDDQTNDLVSKDEIQTKTISTFASSWKVFDLKDVCNDDPTETHGCKNMGLSSTMEFKANEFCKKLFFDTRFDECNNVVDTESILNACTWDYCSCQKTDKTECACESLSMYIRDCSLKGIKGLAKWRDEKLCRRVHENALSANQKRKTGTGEVNPPGDGDRARRIPQKPSAGRPTAVYIGEHEAAFTSCLGRVVWKSRRKKDQKTGELSSSPTGLAQLASAGQTEYERSKRRRQAR
ncbi:unnamed protein product [Brassicogethes aeneus]|uniref:VWFD domain-containing protein n=1 Tax=Brassicogethes aeneus TaxID=1431903 RepID=A0A9P0FIK4_BRAAE|nr:unnamed protein product [Brassicogethes aeneus]